MSKKQLVIDAFNNKTTERVPVGFWFHFANEDDFSEGLKNPAIIETNFNGHLKFFNEFSPDFIKLMSDGFFGYPNEQLQNITSISELKNIQPVGAGHPWIAQQVAHVRRLTEAFGQDIATFYNIFAPATYLKFALGRPVGNTRIADFITQDKEALAYVLDVIAQDLATLSQKVIQEGGADGIYLSVQNVQDPRVTPELYREIIAPSEIKVLDAANTASDLNILHICGYKGSRNDLSLYTGYAAKVINWAVVVEGVSLAEGKRLFGGRAVIGGFDNTADGVLYAGSKEAVELETEKLIAGSGKTGVILGADCTIPGDIALERLNWVRSKAAAL